VDMKHLEALMQDRLEEARTEWEAVFAQELSRALQPLSETHLHLEEFSRHLAIMEDRLSYFEQDIVSQVIAKTCKKASNAHFGELDDLHEKIQNRCQEQKALVSRVDACEDTMQTLLDQLDAVWTRIERKGAVPEEALKTHASWLDERLIENGDVRPQSVPPNIPRDKSSEGMASTECGQQSPSQTPPQRPLTPQMHQFAQARQPQVPSDVPQTPHASRRSQSVTREPGDSILSWTPKRCDLRGARQAQQPSRQSLSSVVWSPRATLRQEFPSVGIRSREVLHPEESVNFQVMQCVPCLGNSQSGPMSRRSSLSHIQPQRQIPAVSFASLGCGAGVSRQSSASTRMTR